MPNWLTSTPDEQASTTAMGTGPYTLTEWVKGWKAKGWKTAAKQPVKNVDLWMRLDDLVANGGHSIEWRWVKGHAGDPGNERADALANRGVP